MPRQQSGWVDLQAWVPSCDIPHSEFSQSLLKPQLHKADLSDLPPQTEQALQKPLLCGGHFLTHQLSPSWIPNSQSPFSMAAQFQEYFVWVLEKRLIWEVESATWGLFGERMGFSSILSAMFRTCAKGGRSDEMGIFLLLYTYVLFKFYLSGHSTSCCCRHIL